MTTPIYKDFNYDNTTTYPLSYPVPTGYKYVTINCLGGNGGTSNSSDGYSNYSLSASYTIPSSVTAFNIIIGKKGDNNRNSQSGLTSGGGSGGGYSQVTSDDGSSICVIAGGSGGGSGGRTGGPGVNTSNQRGGKSGGELQAGTDDIIFNLSLAGQDGFKSENNVFVIENGAGKGGNKNGDGKGGAGGDGTTYGGSQYNGGKGASIGEPSVEWIVLTLGGGQGGGSAILDGKTLGGVGGIGGINSGLSINGGGGGGAGYGGGGGGAGGSIGGGGGAGGSYLSSINRIKYLYEPISNLTTDPLPGTTGYNIVQDNNGYVLLEFTNVDPPSTDPPICYNAGTQILSLTNPENKESYKPIEELRKGDLIKTYLHGYRRITHIGKRQIVNNPLDWKACMYIMKKTDTNGLVADLIVTGRHSILVDDYTTCTNSRWLAALPLYNCFSKLFINTLNRSNRIDDKYLLNATNANAFAPLQDTQTYTYYHLVLEGEGEGKKDRRYGIWANGILSETTYQKDYLKHNFEDL